MTARTLFHFYSLATGYIANDRLFVGSQAAAQANAPEGMAPIAGVTDPLSQRVDLASGQLVARQRPASPGLQPVLASPAQVAQHGIDDRERRQIRQLRELVIALATGQAVPAQALQRLQQADADVANLRTQRGGSDD